MRGPGNNRRHDDPYKVYEVADGVYWVGFADRKAGFSNNPYLLVGGDEAILIDPGSVLHYHVVAKKVLEVVRPEQIATIIVQHQDPDAEAEHIATAYGTKLVYCGDSSTATGKFHHDNVESYPTYQECIDDGWNLATTYVTIWRIE